jgi:hypothetical protein
VRNPLNRMPSGVLCRTPALALILAVVFVISACATDPGGSEPQGEVDLFAYLPGPASVIGWVDFDALRGSTLALSYLQDEELLGEGDEALQEFIAKTGVDPRTDLKKIAMVAFDGEDGETEGVVVGTVNFDRDRLMTSLADSPTLSYRDQTLYELEQDAWESTEGEEVEGEHGEEGEGEHGEMWVEGEEKAQPGYIVIINDQTLMVGSETGVKFALDTAAGERPKVRDDAVMSDMIMSLPADDQIWIIAADEAWAEELAEMPAEGASPVPIPLAAIEGVEVVTLAMHMSDAMRLRLSGIAASEEDATLISQSMLGLLAMGKMMIQQAQPELFNIVDRGLLIDSDNRIINIEANLSAEDIATLRELAEERVGDAVQGSIEG